MAAYICAIALAGAIGLGVAGGSAWAEDGQHEEDQQYWEDLARLADNTSFVWTVEALDIERNQKFAAEFAQDKEFTPYPTLGGFAVAMSWLDAEARRVELASRTDLPKVDFIESDTLVYGFDADCGNDQAYPSSELTDPGVTRVGGPLTPPYTGRVWVIDSGIASTLIDGAELDVDRTNSRVCDQAGCTPGPANQDKIGHGTVIAGIIAAIDDSDGFVGVAPGAKVIPIQIFEKRRPIVRLKAAYNALQYLLDPAPTVGARSGDVVNISWGADWDPRPGEFPRKIEELLRDLADMGVKVAVAAGNNDTLKGSGYVVTVTPARAGAYRSTSGGAVVTVSAAESTLNTTTGVWSDVFWADSVFGNGELDSATGFHRGPPDFAEPGVNVASIWPGPRRVVCTGTSFATAHMSGILLKGMPKIDKGVTGDPSATMNATHDAAREDPVGICCHP